MNARAGCRVTSRAKGYGEKAQQRLLQTIGVKEVMREPAITVWPEATVKEAARLTLDHKIGCLPVVEGHTCVGIVTETDTLRSVVSSSGPDRSRQSAGVT